MAKVGQQFLEALIENPALLLFEEFPCVAPAKRIMQNVNYIFEKTPTKKKPYLCYFWL